MRQNIINLVIYTVTPSQKSMCINKHLTENENSDQNVSYENISKIETREDHINIIHSTLDPLWSLL